MKLLKSILMVLLLLAAITGNAQNKKATSSNNNQKSNTNPTKMLTYEKQIGQIKQSMLLYIKIAKPSYTTKDVDECVKILKTYVSEIIATKTKSEGLKVVKTTVEKLNKLNNKCEQQLIETEERENIAGLIILVSSDKGYNKSTDDITEPWREW